MLSYKLCEQNRGLIVNDHTKQEAHDLEKVRQHGFIILVSDSATRFKGGILIMPQQILSLTKLLLLLLLLHKLVLKAANIVKQLGVHGQLLASDLFSGL